MGAPSEAITSLSSTSVPASTTTTDSGEGNLSGRCVRFFKSGAALRFAGAALAAGAAVAFLALAVFMAIKGTIAQYLGLSAIFTGAGFLPGLALLGYGQLWGLGAAAAGGATLVSTIAAAALFQSGVNAYKNYPHTSSV